MSDQPPVRRTAPSLLDLLQIGAVCGVAIGLGVFAGYLVDRAAGTPPLFTFIGLTVGIVGAATGSYRVIRPFVNGASDRAPTPSGVDNTTPQGADTTTPQGATTTAPQGADDTAPQGASEPKD